MHFYNFMLISLALFSTCEVLANTNPDFQEMLDALEKKLNDKWSEELKLIRNEIVIDLKLEMENICKVNKHDMVGVKDEFIDEDVQDALDELNLKVADLEDANKVLNMKIDHNGLDIALIQDDVVNLFLKDKELESNHAQDHIAVVALVQDNHEAIQENQDSMQENQESIVENENSIQENQNSISNIDIRVQKLEDAVFTDIGFNGSNILILGGREDDGSISKKASIINKQSNCLDLDDLPKGVEKATGLFANQHPIYCGGYDGTYRNECFRWNNGWSKLATLKTGRAYTAMVSLSNGFWITGGYNGNRLKSTEYVKMNGEVSDGIELLEAMSGHCMILTSDHQVFIIGGELYSKRKTLIYDVKEDNPQYVGDGPSLNEDRVQHGCTTYASLNQGGMVAIAIGGYFSTTTAEIWNYQEPGSSWRLIENLPVAMSDYPGVLTHPENGVIIVYEENVFHLIEQNGGYIHDKYPVTPSSPKYAAVTMFIQDWMTNC